MCAAQGALARGRCTRANGGRPCRRPARPLPQPAEPFGFKLSPGSGEAFVVIAGRPCLCGFRARAKVRAVVTADLREPPGGRHDTELDGLLLILTVIAIMTIVCALFL